MNCDATRGDAVLLVGHGTTDTGGIAEIEALTALVAQALPDVVVEICFLEHALPSISEGFARLAGRAIERITVVPLLLFAAGHAKRDIPAAVARAQAAYPDWEIRLAPHLGCHPALVELSALRFEEAVTDPDVGHKAAAADTILMLVGRGSYDAEANAEMAAFARLRYERTPVGWFEVCYLSMAEPRVERCFDLISHLPFERVVVQPHLLFRGALFDRLREAVDERARQSGRQAWQTTAHLGPHAFLAEAIAERTGLGGSGARNEKQSCSGEFAEPSGD